MRDLAQSGKLFVIRPLDGLILGNKTNTVRRAGDDCKNFEESTRLSRQMMWRWCQTIETKDSLMLCVVPTFNSLDLNPTV